MLDPVKQPDAETFADAHRLQAAGADCETILVFLREQGFDKIDSIKTIRALYSLSMPEAKHLIDHSPAWSDRFDRDMEFRETAMRVLRDLAALKDPSLPNIEPSEPEEPDR